MSAEGVLSVEDGIATEDTAVLTLADAKGAG